VTSNIKRSEMAKLGEVGKANALAAIVKAATTEPPADADATEAASLLYQAGYRKGSRVNR